MEMERFNLIKKACLIIGKRTLFILPLHYPLVLIFFVIKSSYNLEGIWSYIVFPVILLVSVVLSRGIEVCVKKITYWVYNLKHINKWRKYAVKEK